VKIKQEERDHLAGIAEDGVSLVVNDHDWLGQSLSDDAIHRPQINESAIHQ
jgi:hypothetical protein